MKFELAIACVLACVLHASSAASADTPITKSQQHSSSSSSTHQRDAGSDVVVGKHRDGSPATLSEIESLIVDPHLNTKPAVGARADDHSTSSRSKRAQSSSSLDAASMKPKTTAEPADGHHDAASDDKAGMANKDKAAMSAGNGTAAAASKNAADFSASLAQPFTVFAFALLGCLIFF